MAIKALLNQHSHPAHYLLDHIHTLAEKLQHKLNNSNLVQIHWTPGHQDFSPNERADVLAKQAAEGSTSTHNRLPLCLRVNTLPSSIPLTRQVHLKHLNITWKSQWKKSPCFSLISSVDKSLPSNKYLKLVEPLDWRQSTILTQLHTGHILLNRHLFHIRREELPVCQFCQGLIVETVQHCIFQCPQYQHERHILRRKLKRAANSMSFHLSHLSSHTHTTLPLFLLSGH